MNPVGDIGVSRSKITAQASTDDGCFEFIFEIFMFNRSELSLNISLYYKRRIGTFRRLIWQRVDAPLNTEVELGVIEPLEGQLISGMLKSHCESTEHDPKLIVWARLAHGAIGKQKEFLGPFLTQQLPFLPGSDMEEVAVGEVPIGSSDEFTCLPPQNFDDDFSEDAVSEYAVSEDGEVCENLNHTNRAYVFSCQSADLFPYTYMRNWPDPANRDLELLSIAVAVENNAYFAELNAFAELMDRSAIEKSVKHYIDNHSHYIPDRRSLNQPFADYLQIYDDWEKQLYLDGNYDASRLMAAVLEHLDITEAELKFQIESPSYQECLDDVKLSYISNVVKCGYKSHVTNDFFKALLVDHALNYLIFSNEGRLLRENKPAYWLWQAFIVLPSPLFPLPEYHLSPPVGQKIGRDSQLGWVRVYGIGELQLVKKQLKCYEAGDISQLVNIMPGEIKKLSLSDKRSRTTTLQSLHQQQTQKHNLNWDIQDDLVREMSESLAGFKDTYCYSGLKTAYGPPTNISLDGQWSVEKVSTSPSNQEISQFAKKVLQESAAKIESCVSQIRVQQETIEQEENTISTFDNSGGSKPILGVYRWLNKIYETQVVNYGQRLMLSFSIPNPANHLIQQADAYTGIHLQVPRGLEDFGIASYKDINAKNLVTLLSYYRVEGVSRFPTRKKTVSSTILAETSKNIAIPEGYVATVAHITYILHRPRGVEVSGIIGRNSFQFGFPASHSTSFPLNQESATIPLSVSAQCIESSPPRTLESFSLTVEIECEIQPEVLEQWQYETYLTIVSAYEEKLADYYNQFTSDHITSASSNDDQLKISIFKALRHQCMAQLLRVSRAQQLQPADLDSLDPYQVNIQRYRQFLDTAIEWDEITYIVDTFSDELYDAGTSLCLPRMPAYPDFFTAFLQAHSARVFVPVRNCFSHSLLFFLSNGNVWQGKDRFAPVTVSQIPEKIELVKTLHQPTDNKVGNSKNCHTETVIDRWTVKIPTSMQILTETDSVLEDLFT